MGILATFWKTIIWIGIILFLSLTAGENLPHPHWLMFPHIDKAVHFVMYFVFALVLIHDLKRSGRLHGEYDGNRITVIAVLIVILWGGIVEILQRIPIIHRDCDFFDFLANAAGAFLASLLYRRFEPLLDKINHWIINR